MEAVAFFVGAIGAIGGAVAVVTLRNPFYSVLGLLVHLIFLAGLFLLLRAQFLAAAQIIVYAGAVVVLYVFVASYVGGVEEARWDTSPELRVVGPILAVGLFITLSIAIIGSVLSGLGTSGPDQLAADFGTPAGVGKVMLQDFLLPFEGASLLLMVAAIAAVILAGRRRRDTKDPA